jgi:TolB-like protein
MMAENEDDTLTALRAHRNVIDPIVLNHGGRVVKNTGDGLIVEFPSATSAVDACIEAQRVMETRNRELPESRRMQFRMGVNLGDVVEEDDGDLFGDGINVAARIEAESDPGGVAVSDAVARAVAGTTSVGLVDMGEYTLKNIPRPVRIWKLAADSPLRQTTATGKRILATVAVLPFDNMSADPDQDYFVDGITEDLITALSYDKNLAVIARNSTFAYRDTATDARRIARELDATHIVEGSARRSGDRIRVTTQLIDAESGHHMWAERFDRDLEDVFDLQDELVEEITTRLSPSLRESVGQRRQRTPSVTAWDLTVQAYFLMNKFTPEGLHAALDLLAEARSLEPEFAPPVAASALARFSLYFFGWGAEGSDQLNRFEADAEEAHQLDPRNYEALNALAFSRANAGRPAEAKNLASRMIEINPYGGAGYHVQGFALCSLGDREQAISAQTTAWRLGRHEPWHFDTASDLSFSHYLSGAYEAAIEWGEQCLRLVDFHQARLALAAANAQLERAEHSGRHVEAILAAKPNFSLRKFRSRISYVNEDDRDHIIDGLRKAGLPA